MLNRLKDKKQARMFVCLCCLVYFMSYLTRMNYAASLAEIQVSLDISKSLASLPVTGCFITYGIGQLLCGFLGDRFLPRKMIFTGLAGSCACNLAIALFPYMGLIIPVWCLNGFFQAMLWPPLVRLMAEALDTEQYKKCCVQVSMAASVGSVLVYILVPLCIRWLSWRAAFLLPAVAGCAVAFIWNLGIRSLSSPGVRSVSGLSHETRSDEGAALPALIIQAALLPMLFAIILHGMLRDGITTWMPVYITETFGLGTQVSILTAAVLPVFSIISINLASSLLRVIKNEASASAVLFGASALFSLLLFFFRAQSPAFSVLLMTVTTGCMYGINLYLISRVPGHFTSCGRVATVSGLLNASTYVGSALSAWLFGFLSERLGWGAVIVVWVAVCAAGTILCLGIFRRWADFCRTHG